MTLLLLVLLSSSNLMMMHHNYHNEQVIKMHRDCGDGSTVETKGLYPLVKTDLVCRDKKTR